MSDTIERTSFDTPVLPRLQTIISELQQSLYVIPEFQRPSVWKDEQRLELLDSIIKGLPIGSLLVWRSSTHRLETYESIAGIPIQSTRPGNGKHTYIIDGHQRLTTLFGALVRPPQPRRGREAHRWPIYYVLGTADSPAFRIAKDNEEPEFDWLRLDMLTDGKALSRFRDHLYNIGEDGMADEVERVANVFKDYIIPVVPLVTDNLDLVTDAFVRINSLGSEMTEAHMLRALTYLKPNYDTDRAFSDIRKELGSLEWTDIPDQLLVNTLKVQLDLNFYRSSVTVLKERLQKDEQALPRLKSSLGEAVKLLRRFGIYGIPALPYAHHLITLAKLAAEDPGSLIAREEALEQWFWRTTYTEHFTGQTGGQIRREFEIMLAGKDAEVARGAEVKHLLRLRRGTVRTKAFLLFLTRCPLQSEAMERRAEVLGRTRQPMYLSRDADLQSDPGNAIIAEVGETRELRALITTPELDVASDRLRALADEYVLPLEALALLPDVRAFVRRRREILLERETESICKLGLRISSAEQVEADDTGRESADLDLFSSESH